MSATSKPLFSASRSTEDFDYSWDDSVTLYYPSQNPENCILVAPDDPGLAQQIHSIMIDFTADAGSKGVFLNCALKFGVGLFGNWHGVVADDGVDYGSDNSITVSTTKAYIEANLYEQDWWKPNLGFVIRLSSAGGGIVVTGNAAAVVR